MATATTTTGSVIPIGYIRVSTDHQDNSMDAQRATIQSECCTRKWSIDSAHFFTDREEERDSPVESRPGGAAMIAEAQRLRAAGHHPRVIVTKLDRLGCNVARILDLVADFDARGIALHFIDFGGSSLATDTPAGHFMLTMRLALAEYELNMIRERSRESVGTRRAAGLALGTIPYGFAGEPTGRMSKSGRPVLALVQHPTEYTWLQQIHQRITAGLPDAAIAGWLNDKGVPTKNAGGTRRRTVTVAGESRILDIPIDGRWHQSHIRSIRLRLDASATADTTATAETATAVAP